MMRRHRVVLREQAYADLDAIARFIIASGGTAATAEAFVGRIWRRCQRIGDAPHAGRPRDDLAPGLRSAAFERSAVILYRVEDDRVRVINIFYGGRDYEALYRDVDED